MPRPKTKTLKPSIESMYPLEDVRAELKRLDDIPEFGHGWRKQAAAAIGMTETEFSKHINASNARKFFHVEELGRIAAWVSKNHQGTPPGWPLVAFRTWDHITRGWRNR